MGWCGPVPVDSTGERHTSPLRKPYPVESRAPPPRSPLRLPLRLRLRLRRHLHPCLRSRPPPSPCPPSRSHAAAASHALLPRDAAASLLGDESVLPLLSCVLGEEGVEEGRIRTGEERSITGCCGRVRRSSLSPYRNNSREQHRKSLIN